MRYLMDTNVVLVYLRNDKTKDFIEENFAPFDIQNIPIVSVVTLGEIESISLRNNWGTKRLNYIRQFFDNCVVADINAKNVIDKYGEIDAYSQGKLLSKPLQISARNMGKNDLWIAATAAVSNATLLTMDKDFMHLDESYMDVVLINLVK